MNYYQILIVFDRPMNILDTTGHQMTICVINILAKIIKTAYSVFELQSIMSKMFFWGEDMM